MSNTSPTPESYETLYERLQQVVAQLEQGDMPLADTIAAYEEGIRLAAACQQLLDAAELRVRQLQPGPDGPDLIDWDE
jgi:exodeoxyribonuclease VII small subunit